MQTLAERLLALPDPESTDGAALHYPDHGFTAADVAEARERIRESDLISEDAPDDEAWRLQAHAFRLIIRSEGIGALDLLLGELEGAAEWGDDEFPDLFADLVSELGAAALPGLLDALTSRKYTELARIDLIEPLNAFARETNHRQTVLDAYLEVLRGDPEERGLKAFVVMALLDLDARDALPAIRAAFEANLVDVSVGGDLEEFEIEFGQREKRSTPAPNWMEREAELVHASRLERLGPLPVDAGDDVILDYYLRLHRTADTLRGLAELDGFLLAVIVAPEPVPPARFHDFVWGVPEQGQDPTPGWESDDESEAFFRALMNRYNAIVAEVDRRAYTPPESTQEDLALWTTGLLRGTRLWDQKSMERPDSPHHRLLLAATYYALPDTSKEETVTLDMLRECIAATRHPRAGSQNARVSEPVTRDAPKAGRNDPCPCGSGRKYKRCCMN